MLRSKSICNEISVFFHSYFLFSKLWIICKRPKVNMSWYKELWDKSKYINIDVHVFQMKTADIESVANRKSRRCYASIPMDISNMMNTRTTQHRRCYAGITMDKFLNMNTLMVQRRRRCANIPMNTSITTNVLISQLGTSCAFDSPGLARNEPTLGKRSQGDSTPSVLSFFYEGMLTMKPLVTDYSKKAQHLRRCSPHNIY